MSAAAQTQAAGKRGAFQGAGQILRYNRRFYAAALAVVVAGLWFAGRAGVPGWLRAAAALLVTVTAFWAVSSLAVSHYVYDRSPLYRFVWLRSLLAREPRHWANIHAGLDESSAALGEVFAGAAGEVLDIYDAAVMTEPAIKRARQILPPCVPATRASFRRLPLGDGDCDAAFVIFTAHELREAEAREAFFAELRRVLSDRGSVVLVEHLRDAANFVAFGPGAWHFLPRREWLRVAQVCGFAAAGEVSVTPFVRALRFERR
jgi:SAM-dependent methyltransferase